AWIEFDREHLRQVMWNLLRNAARYAGSESGAVRIALRGYGGRVELSVIDNGPGVPAARQGQLFEPFFTTEAKGTGLGLYLARELCAANRATLEYVNDGPGAHFRILCREPTPHETHGPLGARRRPGAGGRRRARYPRAPRADAPAHGARCRGRGHDRGGEGAPERRALRPVPHRHAPWRRRRPR